MMLYKGNPELAQIHEKWDVSGSCKIWRCLHLWKFWISKSHNHPKFHYSPGTDTAV